MMTCKLEKYALSVGQDKWCGFSGKSKTEFCVFWSKSKKRIMTP